VAEEVALAPLLAHAAPLMYAATPVDWPVCTGIKMQQHEWIGKKDNCARATIATQSYRTTNARGPSITKGTQSPNGPAFTDTYGHTGV